MIGATYHQHWLARETIADRYQLNTSGKMETLLKVAEIFHQPKAIFRVHTEKRGDVYMCVNRSNYMNDERSVVEVDAVRFLSLWRQPFSSHLDIARGNPLTWPSDYKFNDAETGFAEGEENPVPLAELGCHMLVSTREIWQRRFLFFQRFVGIESTKTNALYFTNGITRTIWLLSFGARLFPVECRTKDAVMLHELAGIQGGCPKTVDELVPAKQWNHYGAS